MDQNIFKYLFYQKFNIEAKIIERMLRSGSQRRYFRLRANDTTAIVVFNEDIKENRAFLEFTQYFKTIGVRVPEIYATTEDKQTYLLEDLGEESLTDLLAKNRNGDVVNEVILKFYKEALSDLVLLQIKGNEVIDYSLCIPRERFDKQSIVWDLNHFKYFCLKISGIPFDEQKLEDDFQKYGAMLESAESDHFMFRDFQSRNIMIYKEHCYFIDYQGGRKGALQYDVASILFEAKADLPSGTREILLEHYLKELEKIYPDSRQKFLAGYYPFVLIRLLQAMGTYGLRGWVEKKPLFLQSMPYAIKNLKWLLLNDKIPKELPYLKEILTEISISKKFNYSLPQMRDNLTVHIFSFSYRKPIPDDLTGNGGGFVFDCRGIHNPGMYDEFKALTGKEIAIHEFFEKRSRMEEFLADITRIVDLTIESYVERQYTHLEVGFGCTGGRHRSVYAAEKLALYLQQNEKVFVELEHIEIGS